MPNRPMPTEYDGITYPSVTSAATALGVSVGWISKLKNTGRMNRSIVALAPGEKTWERSAKQRRQPCEALGFSWASQRDCAKDLGVRENLVSTALANGKFADLVARKKGIRT